MNLNKNKKINKKFDPTTYWYVLLLIIFVLFLLLIGYGVFSFLYIKNQISDMELESTNNSQNSTSTVNNKEFENINNLNKVLTELDNKEAIYNNLLKISTKVSSSSVATSTE
jgi:hypothetical protein